MRLGLLLMLVLSGCAERKSEALFQQFQIMAKAGASEIELCKKAQSLSDAYLQEGRAEDYSTWRKIANIRWAQAQLEETE